MDHGIRQYTDNIADLLMKPMTSGEKRNGFVKKILQHIFRKK